jgi:hypothetical protein
MSDPTNPTVVAMPARASPVNSVRHQVVAARLDLPAIRHNPMGDGSAIGRRFKVESVKAVHLPMDCVVSELLHVHQSHRFEFVVVDSLCGVWRSSSVCH